MQNPHHPIRTSCTNELRTLASLYCTRPSSCSVDYCKKVKSEGIICANPACGKPILCSANVTSKKLFSRFGDMSLKERKSYDTEGKKKPIKGYVLAEAHGWGGPENTCQYVHKDCNQRETSIHDTINGLSSDAISVLRNSMKTTPITYQLTSISQLQFRLITNDQAQIFLNKMDLWVKTYDPDPFTMPPQLSATDSNKRWSEYQALLDQSINRVDLDYLIKYTNNNPMDPHRLTKQDDIGFSVQDENAVRSGHGMVVCGVLQYQEEKKRIEKIGIMFSIQHQMLNDTTMEKMYKNILTQKLKNSHPGQKYHIAYLNNVFETQAAPGHDCVNYMLRWINDYIEMSKTIYGIKYHVVYFVSEGEQPWNNCFEKFGYILQKLESPKHKNRMLTHLYLYYKIVNHDSKTITVKHRA